VLPEYASTDVPNQHFTMNILNLSAYKFVTIEDGETLRPLVTAHCLALGLKGTILLAPEGINLFVAGEVDRVRDFMDYLRTNALFHGRFADLQFKESFSAKQPFRRMLVKLKREIITMKKPAIKPELGRAPSVAPATLKAWLDRGHDDAGRPVVMLDTRNAFEVDVGTFHDALDYRITRFSDFPAVIEQNRADLEGKTVVSFCTGGIRCEKAAIHMQEVGIEHVYQLEGGILNYFEEVGGAHYEGECFVFDYRTALNPQLEPTATLQCFGCRAVVSVEDQASPWYVPGQSCPACHPEAVKARAARAAWTARAAAADDLPRTLRALAHRPAAHGLAGQRAGQLSGCAGVSRAMDRADRGRRRSAQRAWRGGRHSRHAGGFRHAVRRAAHVAEPAWRCL
jgi:UPF0176 protein